MKRALGHSPTSTPVLVSGEAVVSLLPAAASATLGPVEQFVVAKVDGHRTVADLAAFASLSVPETGSIVAYLAQRELVRIDEPLELDELWAEEIPPSQMPTGRPPPQ